MWALHCLQKSQGSRIESSNDDLGEADTGAGDIVKDDVPRFRLARAAAEEDQTRPGTALQPAAEGGKQRSTRLLGSPSTHEDHGNATAEGPWEFTAEDLERFPALRKRNFWCIQRHQARALHYDLRMQLDGATVSWAIPRGLLGMSKSGEAHRLAVQTTLHPISYTTFEGSDGRILPSGRRCGTMLWDVGTYTIDTPYLDTSDSEEERSRKRRRVSTDGGEQEARFRQALFHIKGKSRVHSVHFTLQGGRKMTKHCVS